MSFLKQKSAQWIKVALVTSLLCLPQIARADCASDNPATCSYVTNGQTSVIEPKAFTFSANDQVPTCKLVTNNCGADVMVPTKYESEWVSFLNAPPRCGVTLDDCPALKVTLTSSTSSVLAGGTVGISWTITGAYGTTVCTGSSTDSPSTWTSSYTYTTVPTTVPTGTATLTPAPASGQSSTTYTLSCYDSLVASTTPISGTIAVAVVQPLSITLSAKPASVATGGSTTLSYTVTDTSNVPFQCAASATDNDGVWTGTQYAMASATLSGSTAVSPAPIGGDTSVSYCLTCQDSVQNNVKYCIPVSVGCSTGYTLQSGVCVADCPAGSYTASTNCLFTFADTPAGTGNVKVQNTATGYTGDFTLNCPAAGLNWVLIGAANCTPDSAGQCAAAQNTCGTNSALKAGSSSDNGATSTWTCSSTVGGSDTSCSSCDSGYTLQNGSCVAGCSGYTYNGHCYYAGPHAASCDQTCVGHGGCDATGTTAVGSGGPNAACAAVMQALGYAQAPISNVGSVYAGIGCAAVATLKEEAGKGAGASSAVQHYLQATYSQTTCGASLAGSPYYNDGYFWCDPGLTFPDGSTPVCSRVCACNQ